MAGRGILSMARLFMAGRLAIFGRRCALILPKNCEAVKSGKAIINAFGDILCVNHAGKRVLTDHSGIFFVFFMVSSKIVTYLFGGK